VDWHTSAARRTAKRARLVDDRQRTADAAADQACGRPPAAPRSASQLAARLRPAERLRRRDHDGVGGREHEPGARGERACVAGSPGSHHDRASEPPRRQRARARASETPAARSSRKACVVTRARDIAQVGAARDLRCAQEAQHREAGRVRRRAVVVRARALRERLAVGRCQEEVALAGIEEARGSPARARARAGGVGARAEVEAGREPGREVVEEGGHLRLPAGEDAQPAPVRGAETLHDEARAVRVGSHEPALVEHAAGEREPGDGERVPRQHALGVGGQRRASRG
jgi:hypothetical protein